MKLERQINFFRKYPSYKACFTWDKLKYESGAKRVLNDNYSHHDNKTRFMWVRDFFCAGNHMNANGTLIKADVFFEMGGMNNYYIQLADFRCWFKIVTKYPIYIMKEELVTYRRHDKNLSIEGGRETTVRSVNENIKIMRDFLDHISAKVFWRSFFPDLIYKKVTTEEEFAASKFFYLYNSMDNIKAYFAMEIYYGVFGNGKWFFADM